jgi:hypothetical protein
MICKLSASKCKIYERTIGLYCISEEIVSGFTFCLQDALTRGLLLGVLGWREKRGFVSLLSESPLGQPLVPGSDRIGTGYEAELSTYDPGIPSLQRKPGDGIVWLKGRETRGWVDYQLSLFGNAMNVWDIKLGNVGLGRKICCLV